MDATGNSSLNESSSPKSRTATPVSPLPKRETDNHVVLTLWPQPQNESSTSNKDVTVPSSSENKTKKLPIKFIACIRKQFNVSIDSDTDDPSKTITLPNQKVLNEFDDEIRKAAVKAYRVMDELPIKIPYRVHFKDPLWLEKEAPQKYQVLVNKVSWFKAEHEKDGLYFADVTSNKRMMIFSLYFKGVQQPISGSPHFHGPTMFDYEIVKDSIILSEFELEKIFKNL